MRDFLLLLIVVSRSRLVLDDAILFDDRPDGGVLDRVVRHLLVLAYFFPEGVRALVIVSWSAYEIRVPGREG